MNEDQIERLCSSLERIEELLAFQVSIDIYRKTDVPVPQRLISVIGKDTLPESQARVREALGLTVRSES